VPAGNALLIKSYAAFNGLSIVRGRLPSAPTTLYNQCARYLLILKKNVRSISALLIARYENLENCV